MLDIAQKIPAEQKASVQSTQNVVDGNEDKTVMYHKGEADKTEVSTPPEVKPETLNAQEIIEQGIRMAGVDGLFLVNKEGLVLESEWSLKNGC